MAPGARRRGRGITERAKLVAGAASSSLDRAQRHLAEVMDRYHEAFDVYTDYEGFDFDTDGDVPWFEGTGQMAVAYWALGDATQARFCLGELREVQASAPNANGKGIVAAPADGSIAGLDWLYYNRLHVGATAWYALAERWHNPYWQTSLAPYRLYLPVVFRSA